MDKILLVGATGYLGQHIKKYYSQKGFLVETLGRSSDSTYLLDVNGFESLYGELVDKRISKIIHVAAVNEVKIEKNLLTSYEINVTLTRLLMELAFHIGVKEFVYVSTFHVYGVDSGLITESTEVQPRNDYGVTHYLSELIVGSFGKKYDIKTHIVRPTNIYGMPVSLDDFSRWSLVQYSFVKSAKYKGEVALNTSGVQLRNFVPIEVVLRIIDLPCQNTVVNACGAETISIRDLAYIVADVAKNEFRMKCDVSWEKDKQETSCLEISSNSNIKIETNLRRFICDFWMKI